MTTMTLTVDDNNIDILEAFKILASKFKGVSFEIERKETKAEILNSFKTAIQDIKSGDMAKNSISSDDFFKEFKNG